MNSRNPIFIGGLMRSGTTLLRAMLAQHSAIASGLETHWFDIDWRAGTARDGEPLRGYLHRIGQFFEIEAAAVDHLIGLAEDEAAYLDLFMSEVARRAGKRRWAEKTTGNIRHLDRIIEHWPEARIIHIYRDPKDVFASFRRGGKYGGAAEHGALWCDFFGDLERFKVDLPLGPENLLEMRYEDLVLAPEAEMRRVLAFLDEPWEAAVARFEGNADEHDRVRELTGHASTTLAQIARPLGRDRIGLWRGVIDERDMAVAREVVAGRGLGPLFARIEAETPTPGGPEPGGAR
ncbi:MAG: sulfotransferase [Alphaproteobacteria bacterium]|jgi:hypothetical protein|nr:sulfotransferase [Alphaproteobacteria bacterium]MDP6811867.1 sulfotransferase [Alphaproteobacteria bacterium]